MDQNQKVIHIEVCQDCAVHEWCTHHDEKKYNSNFESVKSAIQSTVPGCEVVRNIDIIPKIGAFEVSHQGKNLFSKIKSGLWPNPTAIAQRVKSYFDDLGAGKDVTVYGTSPEKAFVPPKKKIDPTSSRYGRSFLSSSTSQTGVPKTDEPESSKQQDGQHEPEVQHHEEVAEVESPVKKPQQKQEEEVKPKPAQTDTEEKPKPKVVEEEQKQEKKQDLVQDGDHTEHHEHQQEEKSPAKKENKEEADAEVEEVPAEDHKDGDEK